jgi:hypothetical protein
MLHMTLASNILIAIGGHPEINTKGFVPDYPGPLPMSIGGLIVGIESFSIPLVQNIFMAIEEPENEVPVKPPSLAADFLEPEYATIGQFNDAIKQKINDLGSGIFTVKTAPPQVVNNNWFAADKLFPITDAPSACKAIDIIKIEGEGTSTTPFQSPEDPAHFYKFGEIVNGRMVVQTPDGFAYNGANVLFDPSGVCAFKAELQACRFRCRHAGADAHRGVRVQLLHAAERAARCV